MNTSEVQNGDGPPLALYEKLVDTLVEEFDKQHEAYREIVLLGRQLQECLESNDSKRVIDLVAEKQKKVDALAQMETEIAPYKEVWAKVREQVPESCKEVLKQKVDSVGEVLRTLLEIEQENEKKLSNLTQSKQKEVQNAQQKRKAFSAYNLRKPTDLTKYLDKKG